MVRKRSILPTGDKLPDLGCESGTGTPIKRRGKRSFSQAYRELREALDFAELAIDPEEVFANVRDPAPGRR
jgi:hypothetical protein